MTTSDNLGRFEQTVLPHMDAAYNLARWLTRNDHDAEDVVQEAVLRAYRFFDGFQGTEPRQWLLKIVRNTFYTWYAKNRGQAATEHLDDEAMQVAGNEMALEEVLIRDRGKKALMSAIESLPIEFREVLLLREFEGYSYKEIADVIEAPIGTVMSRLSRARQSLKTRLSGQKLGDFI
ncbi:MAG TPA: sigma-70 family RNA polymerase sigma factor [Gammaproteobacteria bacterium]|nr:sigma-70 family RNA polymerase sigma factor [Gammaproteobacteria bacterium]